MTESDEPDDEQQPQRRDSGDRPRLGDAPAWWRDEMQQQISDSQPPQDSQR